MTPIEDLKWERKKRKRTSKKREREGSALKVKIFM